MCAHFMDDHGADLRKIAPDPARCTREPTLCFTRPREAINTHNNHRE